jgi:hypothetical protein
MEHVPIATIVTVATDTVQTGVVLDVKLTASPELAVAEMANGAVPKATLPSDPKAIVWVASVTANVCVAGVAAE